jgi:hypothetical protein
MKIQITGPGIYGLNGDEIPIGTEFEVDHEPEGWRGRYTVLQESKGGKTAATGKKPEDPERAELEALKVDELKELADQEKVDLKGASAKGDMIDHILKARADRKAAA